MPGYSQFLLPAIKAARAAGEAILEVYRSEFSVDYKEDRSPLTEADRRAHRIIRDMLKQAPIELPILSEEGRDIPYSERSRWKRFWMVDPLDGTKEFIHRRDEFTVNIALIEDAAPVLGVIHIPVQDTLYFAASGLGAFRIEGARFTELFSGKALPLNPESVAEAICAASVSLPVTAPAGSVSEVTVVGSRSHGSAETEAFVEKVSRRFAKVSFVSAGSALKFCRVAEGAADVYPRFGPTMEWDTAAGQAIVEQTGGTIRETETGAPLRYNKENLLNPFFIAAQKGWELRF